MLSETGDDLDLWQAFIGEEFDSIALLNLYDFATSCPMDPFLPGDRFRQLSFLHTETLDGVIISMSGIS
jgi:hypothetical protein